MKLRYMRNAFGGWIVIGTLGSFQETYVGVDRASVSRHVFFALLCNRAMIGVN